jgi:ABC-2 type transport system permease protein
MAIMRRDIETFISYRMQLITRFASIFFTVALFYYLSRLVTFGAFKSPTEYFGYVVIGMVILETLQSTMGVGLSLRGELVAGTFERLILSPFGPVAAVLAMMLFPFLDALLSAMMLLAFGTVVFGMEIHWGTAALALPVALLGTCAFAVFGLLFAAVTVLFKQALGSAALVAASISLLSGLYFPITLLPSWIQGFARVQPFTPAVELMRHVLVGYPLVDPAGIEIAKVAGFIIVVGPLAAYLLSAAVRLGQRRGTIIEY